MSNPVDMYKIYDEESDADIEVTEDELRERIDKLRLTLSQFTGWSLRTMIISADLASSLRIINTNTQAMVTKNAVQLYELMRVVRKFCYQTKINGEMKQRYWAQRMMGNPPPPNDNNTSSSSLLEE